MKTIFTFLSVALISSCNLFAQDEGDSLFVADWTAPIASWWPALSAETPIRNQASATQVASFDAIGCNFDTEWAKIAGSGNVIDNQLGNNPSHKGSEDFKDAAFKVFCDADNMYILLQYTDDDVTGTETVEIAWAPYLKIKAKEITGLSQAWYTRYTEFGAYKATFKSTGFDAAMLVEGKTGTVNWGGTNDILSTNLYLDDHTTTGSKTIKQIFTIGYAALTGPARTTFNTEIWKSLNGGKGISFDVKVNDVDADDADDTSDPPVKKPAEYWWNTTINDCWAITWYAGFLNIANPVGMELSKTSASIFTKITSDQVQFSKSTNVAVFNVLGKQVMSVRNVRQLDLSTLENGIFIIRANNESRKLIR